MKGSAMYTDIDPAWLNFNHTQESSMVKPNTSFNLSVEDIALIEEALNYQLNRLTERRNTHTESTIVPEDKLESVKYIDYQISNVRELLGNLHNQKTWYRPKGLYVSG